MCLQERCANCKLVGVMTQFWHPAAPVVEAVCRLVIADLLQMREEIDGYPCSQIWGLLPICLEDIDAVVERIRESEGQKVVVVSAFRGITDRIIEQIDFESTTPNVAFTASIELEHLERVPEIATSPWCIRFADTLHHLSSCLESYRELPDVEVRADALACGERLSSLAIAAV